MRSFMLTCAQFKRAKYELFALQHMQLLVWLQRVQTGLAQGFDKRDKDEVRIGVTVRLG